MLGHVKRFDNVRVRGAEARALVDARESFADKLDVDRVLVGGQSGGVVRVKERKVQEVRVALIDIGNELLAFAQLGEACAGILAVLRPPVEQRDKAERGILGLALESLELGRERTESRERQGFGVTICDVPQKVSLAEDTARSPAPRRTVDVEDLGLLLAGVAPLDFRPVPCIVGGKLGAHELARSRNEPGRTSVGVFVVEKRKVAHKLLELRDSCARRVRVSTVLYTINEKQEFKLTAVLKDLDRERERLCLGAAANLADDDIDVLLASLGDRRRCAVRTAGCGFGFGIVLRPKLRGMSRSDHDSSLAELERCLFHSRSCERSGLPLAQTKAKWQ